MRARIGNFFRPPRFETDLAHQNMEERRHPNGVLCARTYKDAQGRLSRLDGPADEAWDADGQKTMEVWCVDGVEHRVGEYALRWWQHGELEAEYWYEHGQPHRNDAPSERDWHRGKLYDEAWHQRGKLHRLDGPAKTTNGKRYWYLHGVSVTEEEHRERVLSRDVAAAIIKILPQPIAEEILEFFVL